MKERKWFGIWHRHTWGEQSTIKVGTNIELLTPTGKTYSLPSTKDYKRNYTISAPKFQVTVCETCGKTKVERVKVTVSKRIAK